MKDSETSFTDKIFKFGHVELENTDVNDSETEKINDICITYTSSKPIIKDLLSSNDLTLQI
jgi:hypothetical protein